MSLLEEQLAAARTVGEVRDVLYQNVEWEFVNGPNSRRVIRSEMPAFDYATPDPSEKPVVKEEQLYEKVVTLVIREWR